MNTASAGFLATVLAVASLGRQLPEQGSGQRSSPESSQSGNARIFYWGQGSSIGQLTIDYGQSPWKDSYEQSLARGSLDDRRWRLGQNA